MGNRKNAEKVLTNLYDLKCVMKSDIFNKTLHGECFCLGYILDMGGSISTGELAKAASISTARMTKITDALVEKKLVVRKEYGSDRRKLIVEITDAGRQLAEENKQKLVEGTRDFLDYIGKEDAKNLIRIMEKAKDYYKDMGGKQ